ncbi:MAG: slipin family protein [Armatimonadota bacterium]|nr:slipin family protein [bacterium]
MFDAISLLILLVMLGVLVALVWPYKKIRVREYEHGLKYVGGRFVAILPAGDHWINKRTTNIEKVDTRLCAVSIPGQEVLSSDGITLKVSLAADFEISDPDTAVNKIQNYMNSFYLAMQVVLREVVGSSTIEDLLAQRSELSQQIFDTAGSEVEKLGLKLVSANIKDIMFPGDLKKVFAQAVKARNEGLASLEKARGETAALRSLANAAKMIESNPALMQLRMMHSMGDSSGNTYVVGLPASVVPLSASSKQASDAVADVE